MFEVFSHLPVDCSRLLVICGRLLVVCGSFLVICDLFLLVFSRLSSFVVAASFSNYGFLDM